jgi:hypothetical protein
MAVANTLAYYNTITIMTVKSYIVQSPEVDNIVRNHFFVKIVNSLV